MIGKVNDVGGGAEEEEEEEEEAPFRTTLSSAFPTLHPSGGRLAALSLYSI